MNPNYPGGDPSYPGDPNTPPSYPQQPGQPPSYPPQPQQPPAYGQQPTYPQQPSYPQQPPAYNQAPPPQYPQQPGQYPPPAYNQAPPPQYPQQPQQQKSRKGWIIGCSIAALVVLLACGGVGVALYIGAQKAASAVQSTGQAALAAAQVGLFCTDVESQDYGSAYQLLSSAKQGSVSQAQYSTHAAALDASDGTIATCTLDPNHPLPSLSNDGKSATAQVQVARDNNSALVTGSMKLVYENGDWKIDSADSSLKLP